MNCKHNLDKCIYKTNSPKYHACNACYDHAVFEHEMYCDRAEVFGICCGYCGHFEDSSLPVPQELPDREIDPYF